MNEPTDDQIYNEAIRVASQIKLLPFDVASFQMGAKWVRNLKLTSQCNCNDLIDIDYNIKKCVDCGKTFNFNK